MNTWAATPAAAAPKTILIVSSNSHFGFVHRIEALVYSQPNVHAKLIHQVVNKPNAVIEQAQLDQADLIVTMGTQALEAILASESKQPIFSMLVRKHVFHQLLNRHQYHDPDHKKGISALYLDQPPERQFQLIKVLFPAPKDITVGILMHANTMQEKPLSTTLIPAGISLVTAYMNEADNPSDALRVLLEESKVLLALPDSGLYNAKTARGILLTAYHNRMPVIAYSRTFVNNGAVAAVYSSPKQIALQASQMITQMIQHDPCRVPPPTYPDTFSVAVNYQVARTLGLNIPSENTLEKILLMQEEIPHVV